MSFDLNQLRVLDAMLSERNVSRAAARLGVSQSAVSHALAKLRRQFEDPLFVRSPQGMTPTQRAERMTPFLRTALGAAERLLDDPDHFDPLTTRRGFRISAADHSEVPQYNALPRSIMLCIAHTVSSTGVVGSGRWQ